MFSSLSKAIVFFYFVSVTQCLQAAVRPLSAPIDDGVLTAFSTNSESGRLAREVLSKKYALKKLLDSFHCMPLDISERLAEIKALEKKQFAARRREQQRDRINLFGQFPPSSAPSSERPSSKRNFQEIHSENSSNILERYSSSEEAPPYSTEQNKFLDLQAVGQTLPNIKRPRNWQETGGVTFTMQEFNQNLEDLENWDKDQRFMAAADLRDKICQSAQPLDLHLQKRICQGFLTQLEDASIDVQANAVKCLASIVPKFKDEQIGEVVAKLAQLVLDGKPEVRDIYATCLKGLITELPPSDSNAVWKNVLPRMLQGLCHSSMEVKEECADVLFELLKRFGDKTRASNEHDQTVNALMNILSGATASTPSLRKKGIACIGVCSVVMSDRSLDQLMKLLLNGVQGAKQDYIRCTATVARYVGGRLGCHVNLIAELFFKICHQASDDVNMADDEDGGMGSNTHEVELIDLCLGAFESFVKNSVKEFDPFCMQNGPLFELLQKLLSYDPNSYGDIEDDEEDFEDYDDDGFEDDDESWKVRRSSLKVLSALLAGNPARLPMLYQMFARQVIDRFKSERDENVKCDLFETFGLMIKSSVERSDQFSRAATLVAGKNANANV
eukprot:gene1314-586_t